MGKQFNLTGVNGLYLSTKPTEVLSLSNYGSQLLKDYDFFPDNITSANLFDLKNTKYKSGGFIGSNAIATSNSSLTYSQIYKSDALIANKTYFNTFKLYFKFTSSDLGSFVFPGFSGTSASSLTKKVLNALRIKVYIQIGTNIVPATLSSLKKYTTTWVDVTTSDAATSGSTIGNISATGGTVNGIQLTTGLNSESCIDMRWVGTGTISNLFKTFSPDGYSFQVDVSLPDFDQVALKNKDYKIIVKYYNIGVMGTGVPTTYTTSESVELMSNRYVYYQQISVPKYSSPVSGSYNNASNFTPQQQNN